MNNTIDIGTKINLQNLLISRLLIQANSGGGKSALSRKIIEETYGKVPFIVLDYDGEYYTLKEKFDDILVIGGQYGDVQLSMKSVRLLPKEIIGNQLSVVIDISDLKDSEKIQYVKQFLETMMDLNKDYWKPYLVFIEEAHKLCGEQDKQESGRSVKDLMSRGRKKGYCGILLTQRISKLHKDAAAECNNKFIGRTNLDIDMDRAAKELGFTNSSEFTRLSLRDLQPGHFYAYGTSIEPNHVHEVTIIPPSSKMVKAGHTIDIKPKKPTQRIMAMLSKLNELPLEAAKELKTIGELQKEVTRLTKITSQPGVAVSLPSAKDANQIEKLKTENASLKVQMKEQGDVLIKWQKLAVGRGVALSKINSLSKDDGIEISTSAIKISNNVPKIAESVQKVSNIVSAPRPMVSSGNGTLSPGEKIILNACAQYENGLFRTQMTVLTGYAKSTRNKYLQYLQQKNYVRQDREKIFATVSGIEALGNDFKQLPKGEELQQYWFNNLPEGEAKILKVLVEEHPSFVDREIISDRTGLAKSTRNKYLQYMAAKEIIKTSSQGVKASDDLFEI